MLKATTIKQQSFKIIEGSVSSAKGFSAGGLHAGLKYKNLDLGWVFSEVPANAVGVYTTNSFQAAPLKVTQESIAIENKLQSIIVNSAVANACTGQQGLDNAYEMRRVFARHLAIPEHLIAVASTGVIGDQLPMDKIKKGISKIILEDSQADTFERAILTTDTSTKQVAVTLEIDGKTVTIGGAAKGSGMIHPNMATMLSFITTDAHIDPQDLRQALKDTTDQTFNMITVDGDTSTNDMVLTLANGLADNERLTTTHSQWSEFIDAYTFVAETLAKKIARDGEGATKLIEVHVTGAANEQAAKAISKAIVGSSLVKTAVFGVDPNWGRVICAVGYSDQPLDPAKINVAVGAIPVVKHGLPLVFDEEAAQNHLSQEKVELFINLEDGEGEAVAWGCDLTYDYVKINASYRT